MGRKKNGEWVFGTDGIIDGFKVFLLGCVEIDSIYPC